MSEIDLRLGDCLEVLKSIPDCSIDAILTDLPYGTTSCKWDVIIPFAPMWTQVKRVLKKDRVFVTTATNPFASNLIMSNPNWFKYDWVWRKNRGANFATVKYQPLREHELVLVFSQKTHLYKPQMRLRSEKSLKRDPIGKTRFKTVNITSSKSLEKYARNTIKAKGSYVSSDGLRNPSSVLDFDSEGYARGFTHPTCKPLALYEYLVRTYTNEGDVVLDLTMGSGTTGVACKRLGRSFIGIEQDSNYFEIAKRRIESAEFVGEQPNLL